MLHDIKAQCNRLREYTASSRLATALKLHDSSLFSHVTHQSIMPVEEVAVDTPATEDVVAGALG